MDLIKFVIHTIFIFILVSFVATEYDFKCPHASHRMIRAHLYCNITEENYSCLKDVRQDSYRESCLYKSDFVRMGQKYVIKGNRRNMNCTVNRYQPFKFFSTQLSKCAFVKSSCMEEGQLIFSPGSTKEDSTCGCDYTRGYTFLLRPRNIRFCMPEQEDCTCYVTNCPKNNGLSADYECTQDPMPSSFVSFIVETKSKKNEIVKNGNFDAYQYNLAVPTRKYTISAVATTCITLLIVIVLILFSKYHRQTMRMICIENNTEELDGHKEDNNLENNCDEEHKNRNASGHEEDPKESCEEGFVVVDETFDEEDTIARRIASTIDKLEKTLSKLDKQKAISICNIVKSKGHRGKGILNFLVAVNNILENDKTEEINFMDGIKLIQIISKTLNTISREEIDCIQIPAIVLQWLWPTRVIKIEKQDKLPDDMNSKIIDIRNKFETLYKSLTENHDYSNSLVSEITVFVKSIQNKISLLMKSKDICTEDEVKRVQYKSHKLINLYMDVQFLISAYCIQYYTCYSHSEPCTVDIHQLMLTILKDIEETEANFLKTFAQPTVDTVAFFALFHPSEYDFITEYMKVKGITLQDLYDVLNNNNFAIRPQKWLEYRAVMSYTPTGTIWSVKKPDDKRSLLFEFKSHSKIDNIFLIRSVQWPSWYMYMKDNATVRGQKQKTGPKREWKIVRLDNEKYMICTRKWPSKFIYMDDGPLGKVIASYGDPGTSGYLDLIHENEIDL